MTAIAAVGQRFTKQTIPVEFANPRGLYQQFPAGVTGSDQLAGEFQLGKGPPIIPLILREMKKGPDHWYWALGAITQANPAENAPEGDIEAICQAWLDWGIRRGLVR